MGLISWDRTTPTPTPKASHFTLKVLEKLGRARMGAIVSLLLISSKAD